MTGSWLAIVQGFAGMRVENDTLRFAPFVPQAWDGYAFHVNFRGRLLHIDVTKERTSIRLLAGEPLTIKLNGEAVALTKE